MSPEQEEPLAPGYVEESLKRGIHRAPPDPPGAEPAGARYNAAPNPGAFRWATSLLMAQLHTGRRASLGGSILQLPGTGYVLGNKEPRSHRGSQGTLVPLGISVCSGALFGESKGGTKSSFWK